MKVRSLIAAAGLAGLLGSGCEDSKIRVVGRCNSGPVEIKAVYHQLSMEPDHITFDIKVEGKNIGSIVAKKGEYAARFTQIYCDDGTIMRIRSELFGPGEVYKIDSNLR